MEYSDLTGSSRVDYKSLLYMKFKIIAWPKYSYSL